MKILTYRIKELNKEQQILDRLLYQMIPKAIAEQLKNNKPVNATYYAESTVFFSDIVGFTKISSRSSPMQVCLVFGVVKTNIIKGAKKGAGI